MDTLNYLLIQIHLKQSEWSKRQHDLEKQFKLNIYKKKIYKEQAKNNKNIHFSVENKVETFQSKQH